MAAAADFLGGMDDPWLKPRVLRSLVRDRLPDEKRPLPGSAELAAVLADVKTHGLLSESIPDRSDTKLAASWRAAVDDWVNRLLALISNSMPDKCWAGVCLLGVTCEECSPDRFIASYSVWFQKLLSGIQGPSSTHFVKVASSASLADLFTRLAGFSNSKKDATSLAGKLIQPALLLLNEDGTEAIWEGAVDLLCTLIKFFPSSLHRHYDNVEAVLVSKIMSAKCYSRMSKKFTCCLALLPKVRGDEDSWSLMMQKIVIVVDTLLNNAFHGLEKEANGSEIMKLLVPPGKDPPPPLGGLSMFGEASDRAPKRLRESLAPRVSTLIHCCCMMLTNPYPVQVTVPVRTLLALVGRVLRVDGSLHESFLPFTTAMHQELLCSELPVLHLDSLDLLVAIVKGVRSQLLPHAANIVRLLTEYFRRAKLPSIRIKVYSIMQTLLISMGVGMALYLAQEVINNAFADLSDCPWSTSLFSNTYSAKVINEGLLQSGPRKRKYASGSPSHCTNGANLEAVAVDGKPLTPLSVKVAALKTLEALLTVGGSLKSECWRSNVDLLLITVATNACEMGWAYEGRNNILPEESTVSRADFQLAALEALLASILSSVRVRPPYLSQSLELFRRGKLETGTELAAFCAHALLALEVLIHPRALPLADFPAAKSATSDEAFNLRYPEATFYTGQKPNMPSFSKGDLGAINDDDDEMCPGWLGDNDDQPGVVEGSLEPSHNVDVEMASHEEENVVKSNKSEEPNSNNLRSIMASGVRASPDKKATAAGVVSVDEIVPEKTGLVSGNINANELGDDASMSDNPGADNFFGSTLAPGNGGILSGNTLMPNEDAGDATKSRAPSKKGKETMLSYDSDSVSLDSLPDIVDADPDSD